MSYHIYYCTASYAYNIACVSFCCPLKDDSCVNMLNSKMIHFMLKMSLLPFGLSLRVCSHVAELLVNFLQGNLLWKICTKLCDILCKFCCCFSYGKQLIGIKKINSIFTLCSHGNTFLVLCQRSCV